MVWREKSFVLIAVTSILLVMREHYILTLTLTLTHYFDIASSCWQVSHSVATTVYCIIESLQERRTMFAARTLETVSQ